jgi:hypothetical protein
VRTLTEARAAFPKADQIPVDTTALLADLKAGGFNGSAQHRV